MHAVDVRGRRGAVRRVVLRRFVRADWLAREPDLAAREAAALRAVRGAAVPAPRLLGADPTGDAAGVPAIVMSRLEGVIRRRPGDLDAYVLALAALLPEVHDVAVPDDLPAYRPYELRVDRPPPWASQPQAWERALAVFGRPAPAGTRLIHRDFHPGNVLWSGDAVSGLVDWVVACAGHPDADVGHCRLNLARTLGCSAADRFLEAHRAVAGAPAGYDPWWDVAAALGGVAEHELDPRDEPFLLRAADAAT